MIINKNQEPQSYSESDPNHKEPSLYNQQILANSYYNLKESMETESTQFQEYQPETVHPNNYSAFSASQQYQIQYKHKENDLWKERNDLTNISRIHP